MTDVVSAGAPPRPVPRFHPLLPFGLAVGALALSLFFQSPRLWIFLHVQPNSQNWERGLEFIQQCDLPLGSAGVSVPLTWRLAPALLAKALFLHGRTVLVIPWVGLLLLLTLCARLLLRRTGDLGLAFLTTALLGTTSATLTVTGWLGVNDAWYAAALLVIAFEPGWTLVLLAALYGPWVDERFTLALPLALFVRHAVLGREGKFSRSLLATGTGLAIYLLTRLINPGHFPASPLHNYLHYATGNFVQWLPWTGLGWFMGLRAAWILVVIAIGGACRRPDLRAAWLPAGLALAPLAVITVLAADSGRAPTLLLPLVLLGVERLVTLVGTVSARRFVALLLIGNCLMPAMQVTYKDGDIINSLPVEIVRLVRHI